jgi:hypothetical protein
MITKMSSMCLQTTPNFQGCLNMPSNVDNIFKPTRKDKKHYDLQHKRTSMKFLSWFTQLKISITKASLFWNSFTWAYIPYLSSMLYNYKNWFLEKKKGKKVELIISFVQFFRELNSQLVSAKWLSLLQDYHYRLKERYDNALFVYLLFLIVKKFEIFKLGLLDPFHNILFYFWKIQTKLLSVFFFFF